MAYCKLCGGYIDETTKECTKCGKQYYGIKFKPLYTIIVMIFLLVCYVGVNCFCAISAMNNQDFTKSQKFFDNILVGKIIFSEKYSYVEAGALMEEGKYIEALEIFNSLENIQVPESISESLKASVYATGQTAYREGNLDLAKQCFDLLKGYQNSTDYIVLIQCHNNWASSKANYHKLISLLKFENVAEIIMKHHESALLFLNGTWKNGSYYFNFKDNTANYNLPYIDVDGYFSIADGIFSIESENTSTKLYKFFIVDENTISVYCYKNDHTYKLYRQ